MAASNKLDVDFDGLAKDFGRIDEVSQRVRLAGYGLAAPLVQVRERQMEREVARTAARKGADDPEVATRKAALVRAQERFGLFRAELGRAQIQPPDVKGENAAGLWGRVVRGNVPVVDASVIASAGGKRAAFTCTDGKGGFRLEVPAGQAVMLSIVLKDGSEAFRDRDGDTLQPGQVAFREIDLAGVARPCKEPPGDQPPPTGQPPSPAPPPSAPPASGPPASTPPATPPATPPTSPPTTPPATPPRDDSFPMVQLIGQREPDAQKLIKAQGLLLGDRSTKVNVEQAGRVIDQKPVATTKVRAGDTVAIVVATDDKVDVPSVLGMTPKDAEVVLLKAELKPGKITETPVEAEKAGIVLNQAPVAGDRAARKSEVAMEVGVKRQVTTPTADPKLARVVDLAATRLRDGATDATIDLPAALQKLKVITLADLDKLTALDRNDVRDKLAIRTLAETDRTIAALKKARKELGE
jgi:hypothetical protein